MEIFGIGPMELILILIVALMVFGPDRLPAIGSKLGRAMRDMRRATRAISSEISSARAAVEAPMKEISEPFQEVAQAAKAVGGAAAAVRNPGEAIRKSVLGELNAATKSEPGEGAPAQSEHTIAPPETQEETLAAAQSEHTIAPPELQEQALAAAKSEATGPGEIEVAADSASAAGDDGAPDLAEAGERSADTDQAAPTPPPSTAVDAES